MLVTAPLALASVLLFIAGAPAASQREWPYNLPPDTKYFPEDEGLVRRNSAIQKRLAAQRAVGVRKMPGDDGEMFFPEYWVFESEVDNYPAKNYGKRTSVSSHLEDNQDREGLNDWANSTLLRPLQAPLSLHSVESRVWRGNRMPRAILEKLYKRDFRCPGNTFSCTSINRPNSCCQIGESCQSIADLGLGDVGCCAQGQTCSQQVSSCQQGYKSCSGSSGGGCCIPGYECDDVGCALISTATVVVVPVATASPPSSTLLQTQTLSPVILITPIIPSSPTPPPSSSSSSSSSTSPSSTPASSTSLLISSTALSFSSSPTALSCSPDFRSCPSSLGGGCCPTDRACGPVVCPATSTATTSSSSSPKSSLVVPVRPTSNIATTTTATSSPLGDTCPTGFYQCSAYYHGGCCRVGRDCSLTSCPPSASTTLVNTNGIVIIAPTGTEAKSSSGSCAQGWASCAASAGGGCCPSGYACGQICSATAAQLSATTAKQGNATASRSSSMSPESMSWENALLLLAGLAVVLGTTS